MEHYCPKHGMTECYLKGINSIITCRKCEAEKKSFFAAIMFIIASILLTVVASNFKPTPKSEIESLVGIQNDTFTFPSGADVFDPQWAGETINLEPCTSAGSKDQQIFVNMNEGASVAFNANAAGSYCWQTTEQTDPAKLARMANWWMRNLHVAGYNASVIANP